MSELDQAIAMFQSRRLKEAERLCRAAVKREPKRADAWQVFGIVHYQRGNPKDAVTCFRRAVEFRPDYVEAHNNLGLALAETGRLDHAVESFRRAIALKPDYAEAHNNLGIALKDLGRAQEAVESYTRAIALNGNAAQSHFNLGVSLVALSRFEEAGASFRRVTELDPADAEAHGNLGAALAAMRKLEEAALSHRRAIALRPDHADAHYNLGNALSGMGALDQAVASYERAIALAPQEVKARHNLGSTLMELGRYQDAIDCYDKLLAVRPRDTQALGPLAFCHAALCDFRRAGEATGNVRKEIARGGFVEPFIALALGLPGDEQSACARRFVAPGISGIAPVPAAPIRDTGKIRVAYLSADFRNHPVASAIAELIERHDRERFEIVGVSFGPDDRSEMRARLTRAFDRFIDIAREDDRAAASRMRELGIHIAVDLAGHTRNSRPGLFAYRPAPVQAGWLGFAGTTGIEAIDYILADRIALPFERQPLYSEKIVHLPDSFFVSDSTRQFASAVPARGEAGLPEGGFVFCCFNQSYKFSRPVFDVWMRLLGTIGGSVLWLSSQHDGAVSNIRREAKTRGVDPDRIVFAQRVASPEEHLARHGLADLFLDTLPYNAHATACDALYAGLPVLTCLGEDFPGRVAASMLHAAGLPELVTTDLAAYEQTALRLAAEPAMLAALRARLKGEGGKFALFDTDRFRRHLEAAYAQMWARHQSGEPAASFAVSLPSPGGGGSASIERQ